MELVANGTTTTAGNATPIVVHDEFGATAAAYVVALSLENIGTDTLELSVITTVKAGTAEPYRETFSSAPTPSTIIIGPFPTEDEFGLVLTQTAGVAVFDVNWSLFKL